MVRDVIVVLDVEWTRHPTRKLENFVLAYGVSLTVADRTVTLVKYPKSPDRRYRLSLGHLLAAVIEAAILQGILDHVPEHLTLVMHYGRGDLAACRDFRVIKSTASALKGALVSTRGAAEIDLCPKSGLSVADLPQMPKKRRMVLGALLGDTKVVHVTFRDTSLLVPEDGRRSLDEIGRLVGVPKVELPAGFEKSRMDLLLERDRVTFESYLRADLEIPLRYFQRIRALVRARGLRDVPPTLGACSVALFARSLGGLKDGHGRVLSTERLFAIEEKRGRRYSRDTGRYSTRTVREVGLARQRFEHLMASGYHGGRTETYQTGPSTPGELLYDVDLKSAYPTAMVAIRIPDYDAARLSDRAADFTADSLGVAEVKFACPPDLRFPPFGVRTDHGLVFPRRGTTVATAPEIAAALHLGVEVEVRHGAIIPWSDGDVRPYQAFVESMTAWRDELKETVTDPDGKETRVDGLESLVIKTITNSLYGKTAQAVRPRNVFDTRTGTDRPLSPSRISCAPFAAYTTGLVRAGIAEMLNGIPSNRVVVSVSTDGFLTAATPHEVDVTGPACRVLADNRRRLTGDPNLLEVKKKVLQVVTPRNRAAFTAVRIDGQKAVTAKASVKVPREAGDPNDFLLGLYLDRSADTTVPREDLISLREQWLGNTDLVSFPRSPRINLEPDHKRRLVQPSITPIGGGPYLDRTHLSTLSEPFDTVDDMLETRTLFEGWRHATGRCLKNWDDWSDWDDYLQSALAARTAGRRGRRTAGGSADDLKRQFLRALVRGMWGLDLGGRTYREVANWLTDAGYRTSETAVKNARRGAGRDHERRRGDAEPVPQSVAATDKSLDLLKVLVSEFPAFEFEAVLVAGHVERARGWLASSRRR